MKNFLKFAFVAITNALISSFVCAADGDLSSDGSSSSVVIPDVAWEHKILSWNSSLMQAEGNVLYGLWPNPATGISHDESVATEYGSLTDGMTWNDYGYDFYKKAVVALVDDASLTYSFN